jgi:hypothetical protein
MRPRVLVSAPSAKHASLISPLGKKFATRESFRSRQHARRVRSPERPWRLRVIAPPRPWYPCHRWLSLRVSPLNSLVGSGITTKTLGDSPAQKSGILPDAKSAFLTLQPSHVIQNSRLIRPRSWPNGSWWRKKKIRPIKMLPIRNSLPELPRTAQPFAGSAQSAVSAVSQIRATIKTALGAQSLSLQRTINPL